jgi:spore maturation protein A
MNKIWTFLITSCFIYALFTNNFSNLVNSLFDVPENTIKLLLSIGSLIIIYNGIFQIAIDSKLVKKVSFLFKPLIKRIYKTWK